MARSLLKYSMAEFTVDEGIANSIRPNIYIHENVTKA
jgi:hypothetical protein